MLVKPPEIIRRKVHPRSDTLGAKRIEYLSRDIALKRSAGNPERSRRRVKHREAGVMLGGEHHIAHACDARQARPLVRIEARGIECLGQFAEILACVIFRRPHQGVADNHAELTIRAPVNEEAKALITKPFKAVRLVSRTCSWVVLRETRHRKDEAQ